MVWWLGAALVLLALTPTPVPPEASPPVQPVVLLWPTPGAVLEGETVTVQGRTAVPLFQRAVLEFQPLPHLPATPQPDAWIPLAVLEEPVVQGPLATWEVASLAPGPYVLRLRVFLRSGEVLEDQVQVWVGEPPEAYPTPTASPTPTPVPVATPSASPTPAATPTPLAWAPTPVPVAHPFPQRWRWTLAAGALMGALLTLGLLAAQRHRPW